MIFAALVRYHASDALRSARWVAPGVLFVIITVSGTAVGGTALGGYGLTATALLPIAIWLSVAVLNTEDPVQEAITTATAGGSFLVRLAKLTVALLGCLVLTVFGVAWPLLTGHPATVGDVFAGAVAHLLSSLAGIAVGSLLSRPLLRTPAWAVLIGVAVFMIEILVPGFPPVRPIAVSFSDAPHVASSLVGILALVALETVVGATMLIGLGYVLARTRT
jgi:hypothetical protein